MIARLCFGIVIALLVPQSVHGQVERRARPADSLSVQENQFRFLFRGIGLNADQAAQARRIIRDNYLAMRPFLGRRTDLVMDSVSAVLALRDSLLVRLLASQIERDLFRLNAKEQRGIFVRSGAVVVP